MYRRKKFHQLPQRNQKRIVASIMQKLVWWIYTLILLLAGLGIIYQRWEFIIFAGFFIGVYSLIQLYRTIKRRELRRYFTIDQLQKMNPKYFEIYIVELFNSLGYNLECVGQAGDQGIDGIGKDPKGNYIIMQTKRYKDTNKIQPIDIREFIGTLEYHNVDRGIYVTTGFATSGIHEYIANHSRKDITFVDKDDLVKLICRAYKKK